MHDDLEAVDVVNAGHVSVGLQRLRPLLEEKRRCLRQYDAYARAILSAPFAQTSNVKDGRLLADLSEKCLILAVNGTFSSSSSISANSSSASG